MLVWSGSDYDGLDQVLLPHYLKKEFDDAVELEAFNPSVKNVWLLSPNLTDDNDYSLISKVLSVVFKQPNNNSIAFLDEIDVYLQQGEMDLIPRLLKSTKKRSPVESRVIDSLYELFYVYNFIKKNIILAGPIGPDCIWISSGLIFSENILPDIELSAYQHCHITTEITKSSGRLRACISLYDELKPYQRLSFLSSYFLYCCTYYLNKKDYTHATLLLHRAIETIFKSWLVLDGEIHLNLETGKHSKEKTTYLKDFRDLVLKKRSLTDEEREAIDRLNKLRNESKLAHNYKVISEGDINDILNVLKPLILSDISCHNHFLLWQDIIDSTPNIYKLLYSYFTKNNIIEKYID
jgi:hypothetical protein